MMIRQQVIRQIEELKKTVITALLETDVCTIAELKAYAKMYNNYLNCDTLVDAYYDNIKHINALYDTSMITDNIRRMLINHNDQLYYQVVDIIRESEN